MAETQEKQVYPGNRFEAARRNVVKLYHLLQDPQFDLFGWHQAVNEEMLELQANYFERDFEGDKE
jgi:hypothetical protein